MLMTRTWDIDEMFRRFERDFTDLLGRTFGAWFPREDRVVPPVEVLRTEGELLIRAELPGVDPEKVELTVDGNVLTIRAERKLEAPEGAEYLRRELAHGTFERSVILPEGTDSEKISARYEGGILEVRAPYQGSRAVRIPVEIGSGERKALTAAA